jgi:hypothetical protein
MRLQVSADEVNQLGGILAAQEGLKDKVTVRQNSSSHTNTQKDIMARRKLLSFCICANASQSSCLARCLKKNYILYRRNWPGILMWTVVLK